MKKTLLLAPALACSGVAQAEIYFCQTEKSASVGFSGVTEEKNLDDFIISTSAGFKNIDQESYRGTCDTHTDAEDKDIKSLICTVAKPWIFEAMTLWLKGMGRYSEMVPVGGLKGTS